MVLKVSLVESHPSIPFIGNNFIGLYIIEGRINVITSQ